MIGLVESLCLRLWRGSCDVMNFGDEGDRYGRWMDGGFG